jgi:asparagine synthase (glutamine-hydrolysing)
MCGIAGFAGIGDQADLAAMTRALAHRGPDGEGLFSDREAGVHLGHTRLAIMDLAGGAQPMWNADRSIGIVFNGEIYNHRELRTLLESRGHVFRSSHSDTEVLVHGYAEWGDALPEKLNGMFAFAVFDRRRRQIFLARDRFGEKPLYYYSRLGLFAFASELGAFRRHRGFKENISLRPLQRFFAYGYLPAPDAIYDGCAKLPGGSHLTLDLGTGQFRVRSYWRFRVEPDETLSDAAEDRLAEELRNLLAQAVRRRLMSDVPLGIFLSGGIDSGSVLALAARFLPPGDIKTFTIGFNEPSFDESAAARGTAAVIGSNHAEEILDLGLAQATIPEVLRRLDEPLGDPSLVPTYLLSRFTRRHVSVALSGDGGDELFAGYDPFRALTPASYYHRLVTRKLHRGIRCLADLLPISARSMSFDFKLRRTLMGLSYPASLWNPIWMAPAQPEAMQELFHAPLRVEDIYGDAIALWEEDSRKSTVDRTLEFFTNFYLQDGILAKVDRASMMCSLETRAVFLDNDLVEFCRRLPAQFKYRRGERKYLLKKAIAPLLPRDIMRRPKKGFGIPVASWLRSFPERVPTAAIGGIAEAWIERAWRAHRAGEADHRMLLWCWLSLVSSVAGRDAWKMAA